jgi:hypothetical protein
MLIGKQSLLWAISYLCNHMKKKKLHPMRANMTDSVKRNTLSLTLVSAIVQLLAA